MKNLRRKQTRWRSEGDGWIRQIRKAQARKKRMREQPRTVTNPGLASWLADVVRETFLWQTGATWQREVSGKAANKKRNDCNPQIVLHVAFGGYTIKWSAHFTNLCQQLKHSECFSMYLIYASANAFDVINHFTIADWWLRSILVWRSESKEEK